MNGLKHGQGVFYWPDGGKYEGSYVNNQRTGKATHTFKDGSKYIGNYVNDKKNDENAIFVNVMG